MQPQLVLLQKTFLQVESIGRDIDPELDLWSCAKPFLHRWVRKELGVKQFVKEVRENFPEILKLTPHMPLLIHNALYSMAHKIIVLIWLMQNCCVELSFVSGFVLISVLLVSCFLV